MTVRSYLWKIKATPNNPVVFSIKSPKNCVVFEGQMAGFTLTVVTTCSHAFVSLALLWVFAWITIPTEWIKAFAIWSQLETYFWSLFTPFIKHRFFILSCFIITSNDWRSLCWVLLHSKPFSCGGDVCFRAYFFLGTYLEKRYFFFFVWEGKDNCCLPGYRLISSLLTSGCLAKFTPLPSDLLNNYKTIQAVPIVFYRKALIAWYT